jgi:glycosyltransferase involved in cell wall biosynthesis
MGASDMKIVVAVRCYNETKNIDRFLRGYDFADYIVVSDGGSGDGSREYLDSLADDKLRVFHYEERETINGETWNPDNPHMQFVIDRGKDLDPDWLIFDDMDCVPNSILKQNAREILANCDKPQVNAFRLYMWGEDRYFPYMNNNFHIDYTSLWAWKPRKLDIHTDMGTKHGTILGVTANHCDILPPEVLLHKSWHPETVQKKMDRYDKIGIKMHHPTAMAGNPEPLPEYARE